MSARRRRFWSRRQRLPGGAKSWPDSLASHGDRLCAGPFFCFARPQREVLTEVQPRTRHQEAGASPALVPFQLFQAPYEGFVAPFPMISPGLRTGQANVLSLKFADKIRRHKSL